MEYPNLTALIAAYKRGELNRERDVLTIDNDSTSVYRRDEDGDLLGGKVFDGENPEVLLEEALTLLGVPWRNA